MDGQDGGVANNSGGGDSDMMEFGDNSSSGLSSALMMTPLMNYGPHHISKTQFRPLPFNNNSNHQRASAINMFQGTGKKGHDQDSNSSSGSSISSGMKAKIMAHPLFPRLLAAYVNCQKVGAPPEVVARLEQGCATNSEAAAVDVSTTVCIGEDPALDQFMEAYCEMLTKYEQELTKPFKEAMLFLSSIQCQLKALTVSSSSDSACGTNIGGQNNGCCEDDVEVVVNNFIDPQAEDRELKVQLLRKYSGYIGSLKQEFMKKKKNGKLPKEARQQLLDWWSRHYKWPYPSEAQKLALAESTGLDLKQINNWFINQRKRHWKPSEDMQFVVMDAAHHHHHHPYYYMDSMMYNPFPMDCSSSLL